MNLPNRLTMVRMFLIPVMVGVYLARSAIGTSTYWIIGLIFALASLTDFLDGKIARGRNLVTTFGKFMDPLADKLLVMTALLILLDNYKLNPHMWMPFWVPLVILARELIVTSIRLVAVGEGKIIAASKLGKYKTATTMAAILWYLFVMAGNVSWVNYVGWVLMGLAIALTIVSGVDYFLKNRKLICQTI